MNRSIPYIAYLTVCWCLLWCPACIDHAKAKDFIVVIDAGHGGHDPGAVGRISKEKNINLKVALKLGKQIEQQCPDVKIIYTRQKDVFIPLAQRAEIANEAKADLFISIHTNSLANNHTFKGASTWTLGLAKSDANLDVAKRENAVILYEDDYKTRYAGFNPNSSESYIIFEFMQDKYMSQSVHLASLVQHQLKSTCKRIDRGVHQAGFLVLKASAMPSILVELGFISTPEEERYLNSEAGSSSLANGIFRAFEIYKKEQQAQQNEGGAPSATATDVESSHDTPEAHPENIVKGKEKPVFKVQILTAARKLPTGDKRLKGLKNVEYYREGGLYKYTYGTTTDYKEAMHTKKRMQKLFKDAFIIAFCNGKKIDIHTAIKGLNQP